MRYNFAICESLLLRHNSLSFLEQIVTVMSTLRKFKKGDHTA